MAKTQRKKCPYYEEILMRYCKAFEKKIMIPGCSGKEKYCSCEAYLRCPVFKEHDSTKEYMPDKKTKEDNDTE
jgi:hypothetical protein